MIVSYTNQPTPYNSKNKQHPAHNFDASLTQELKRANYPTTLPSSKLVEHPQNIAKPSNGARLNDFKQQVSFLSSFAIQQYTMLGNLEIQAAKSAILGFNEYA